MKNDTQGINNYPSKPGIIIYSQSYFRENVLAALCTRNIESAKTRLSNLGAIIHYQYNVLNRDVEGKRVFRLLKNSLNVISGNETTIIFKDTKSDLLNNLSENKNVISEKAILQKLKALLRQAITDLKGQKIIKIKDALNKVFPIIDGLNIEKFLSWLTQDGFIKVYHNKYDYFDSRIILI